MLPLKFSEHLLVPTNDSNIKCPLMGRIAENYFYLGGRDMQ